MAESIDIDDAVAATDVLLSEFVASSLCLAAHDAEGLREFASWVADGEPVTLRIS